MSEKQLALQTEVFSAGVFESSGSVTINDKAIPYKTVCQDNLFHNEEGKPIGSMFTYSYFRSDVRDPSARPVMFFFNGGPGSGSLWLNAGLFGPQRVEFETIEAVNPSSAAPYSGVYDNGLCLLDICDLVMIDPVGTGYGRLLDKDAGARFFGLDADADCFADLIHSWLNKHKRWGSPKYLLGESYGTQRAAILAEALSGKTGSDFSAIGLNGIVLLGNAIGKSRTGMGFECEPALLGLPSMAAANWYHNKLEGTLEQFVQSCYDFCAEEYARALYLGEAISEEDSEKIAVKLAHFTGLEKSYIIKKKLRPDMFEFLKELLKDRELELGLYDGRFTLPANPDYSMENLLVDDPAISQYTPAFMAAMCGPIKEALGITFDRKYYAISNTVNKEWKREGRRAAYKSLSASMRRNPELRVMFATGCYDMICTMGAARYVANHAGLPLERVEIKEYASGHMAYLGEPSAKAFANDVRAFIENR